MSAVEVRQMSKKRFNGAKQADEDVLKKNKYLEGNEVKLRRCEGKMEKFRREKLKENFRGKFEENFEANFKRN